MNRMAAQAAQAARSQDQNRTSRTETSSRKQESAWLKSTAMIMMKATTMKIKPSGR